ncbi:hypothetical protein ACFQH2_08360 [Natronoarchaeum sp. GCM10025703]|uniref:hypothetical protein n=1 Tax=Natronoarchaeum sp. GCM10025703 TaxID=3252685 RepID=UPI00361920B2
MALSEERPPRRERRRDDAIVVEGRLDAVSILSVAVAVTRKSVEESLRRGLSGSICHV